MLISLILLTLIAAGGMSLTYLVAKEGSFLWRLAAGSVIGSAIFGLVGFAAACLFGFTPVTILASLAVTMLPLILLRRRDIRKVFLHDWAKAKGKLQGGNLKKFRAFAYYAFFFILFWLFFQQAMYVLKDGIYTGASQNLGDLPFHLGAIFGFTDGNNFPPQNPSWAGARFSYPFIADFITACFVKLGTSVSDAIFTLDLAWALSLLVILERFVVKLTGSRLAGRLAPAILFFTGGLGFIWFFADWVASGKALFDFLWHMGHDYTISDQFRWGNSLVVLFITQRSFLLGMPITLLVLGYLWKVFTTEGTENTEGSKIKNSASLRHRVIVSVLVGLLAGMLPLIHLHSLAVLFVVTAFLFVIRPAGWREWVAFGVGVAIIAVPELVWSISGSATETTRFFDWHFGWDRRDQNIVWFWIKNTGIAIPVLIAGIYLVFSPRRRKDAEKTKVGDRGSKVSDLLWFYLPFLSLFLLSNAAKLAPWEWDNIKILIYWFVGSLPFIALALAHAWELDWSGKLLTSACMVLLTGSGVIDVWRTASGQVKIKAFDADAVVVAEQIKQKTAPDALFLNAPTYNSAVVLSGRRSLMRYSGHLASHGIDFAPREADVKLIYQGGGMADALLKKYNIEYVLVSPEEKTSLGVNEGFFKKYPVVAEAGQYRVYQIK